MWLFIYRPRLYPWAQGRCQLDELECWSVRAYCMPSRGLRGERGCLGAWSLVDDLFRPADLSQVWPQWRMPAAQMWLAARTPGSRLRKSGSFSIPSSNSGFPLALGGLHGLLCTQYSKYSLSNPARNTHCAKGRHHGTGLQDDVLSPDAHHMT